MTGFCRQILKRQHCHGAPSGEVSGRGKSSHFDRLGCPSACSNKLSSVLRDGGHWLVVGGQVAREDAGKIVGKGNMRAQIEQVGKNVDACLKAGGANVSDVVFSVTRSTALAEFDKHTDLAQRYFGPPSPKSLTVQTEQLPSPDYLLQVEAYAEVK